MRRLAYRTTSVLIALCALFSLGVICARAGQTPADNPVPPKFRLPADVVGPTRYRVDLTLIPDQDTFTGAIDIDLEFKKPSSVLWLNSEKLEIKDATLTFGGEKVAAKIINEPHDYVGFAFGHHVGPGAATPTPRSKARSAARTIKESSR